MPPTGRAKHWTLTLNNYTEDQRIAILGLYPAVCSYVVIGKEVGESGTPHLQGFLSFVDSRKTFNQVKALVPAGHWEVAKKPPAAAEYCKKDGDYTEVGTAPKKAGARVDLDAAKVFIHSCDTFAEVCAGVDSGVLARYPRFCRTVFESRPRRDFVAVLRRWQQQLLDICAGEPDARQILFYVDETGGTGKSFMARYLVANQGAFFASGKSADVLYAYDGQRVVIWDIPRSQNEFMNYGAIEKLKDGLYFSGKYESGMRLREGAAHVIVFMNQQPDPFKLSADRYNITEL